MAVLAGREGVVVGEGEEEAGEEGAGEEVQGEAQEGQEVEGEGEDDAGCSQRFK